MYPHRIRLRGPWECEPLTRAGGGDLPPKRRVTMPARWRDAGLDFAGSVRFRRHFGYPGRIDPHERVWLTFAGVAGTADVHLNGKPLGRRAGDSPFEFDVTPLLRQRNDLWVDVEEATGAGGLWGEVALEVRCTAFLRGVRAWWAEGRAALHVSGELVGTCDGPLELYALAGRANVLYAPLTASGGTRRIDLTAHDLPPAALTAPVCRVELVHVAVVWYAMEVPISVAVKP